jgi:hypothetical protein
MTLAVVGLGALTAASVQSATGLGFALLLSPIVFAFLSPTTAIVLVTALGLELNLLVLLGERRQPAVVWREAIPILGAAIPGTACGVLLLSVLPKPVLQLAVGVGLIVAAAMRTRLGRPSAGSTRASARLAVGFTTGAMTTSTGVSGPPLALWLSRRGLTSAEVRDSLSAMFLAVGVIAFAALLPVLGNAHLDLSLLVAGLGCVLGGHTLGRLAFLRLEMRRFDALLQLLIVCAGVASIVAGLASL